MCSEIFILSEMSFKYIEHRHYFDTPKNAGNMALFSFFGGKKTI